MKAKATVGFEVALTAYRPHIEIAFPSCCLRAVPHKVSGFSYFRSDYPSVRIVIDLIYPGYHKKFVISAHESGSQTTTDTSTVSRFAGLGCAQTNGSCSLKSACLDYSSRVEKTLHLIDVVQERKTKYDSKPRFCPISAAVHDRRSRS